MISAGLKTINLPSKNKRNILLFVAFQWLKGKCWTLYKTLCDARDYARLAMYDQ